VYGCSNVNAGARDVKSLMVIVHVPGEARVIDACIWSPGETRAIGVSGAGKISHQE
jgi:hypothetical protein